MGSLGELTVAVGDPAAANYQLAGVLARAGRGQEAARRLEEALRLRPGWVEAEARLRELRARLE